MPNFLLIGNGAREHAIAEAVCKKGGVKLFAYMNARNPGIMKLCLSSGGEFAIGEIENGPEIVAWTKGKKIDLAFASPDAVLAAGVGGELENAQIRCASPTRFASRIEWDKKYLRELMQRHSIEGCPEYKHFSSTKGVDEYIDKLGEVAIKPVGLTGGKGVKVMGFQLKDLIEAKKYARDVLVNSIGGGSGLIVEKKLEGEEFTLMAFCDGKTLVAMPCVQDHKRAFNDDLGPNTGGMGSYSDNTKLLPFMKNSDYEQAQKIMEKIMEALAKEGVAFKGVMYGQFMAGGDGMQLIETNARFGDPEAMNVLALLKTPLYDIFEKIADAKLSEIDVDWEGNATVVKYLVPNGYPQKSVAPEQIYVDDEVLSNSGAQIYFASVEKKEGKIYSGKSRSVAVLGKAGTIADAEKIAEAGCTALTGPLWHRGDIGTAELIEKRIKHIKELRGE